MNHGLFFIQIIPQILVIIIAICILYSSIRVKLNIDPGFIHLMVHLFAVCMMVLSFVLIFEGREHYWVLWSSHEVVAKVINQNMLYVVVFTASYITLAKLFGSRVNAQENYLINEKFYRIDLFLITFLIVLFIDIILKKIGLFYLRTYWGNVLEFSFLITVTLVICKLKSLRAILLVSFLGILYMMFIHLPLMESERYVVNRGGVVKMFGFLLVFIHIVGKHKIFTISRLITALVVLPLILGIASFVEDLVNDSSNGWVDLLVYVGSGYELRMMENQALIMHLLESNLIEKQWGESYLFAMKDIIYPTMNEQMSPTNWLQEYINKGGKSNSGYNFSFIAEGILNFGNYGVFSAGIISAILLYFVRYVLKFNWKLSPFIFANLFFLSYYVYRSDFSYMLKKIVFTVLSFVIVFIIISFMRMILPVYREK